jgi:hypothetical protein
LYFCTSQPLAESAYISSVFVLLYQPASVFVLLY